MFLMSVDPLVQSIPGAPLRFTPGCYLIAPSVLRYPGLCHFIAYRRAAYFYFAPGNDQSAPIKRLHFLRR